MQLSTFLILLVLIPRISSLSIVPHVLPPGALDLLRANNELEKFIQCLGIPNVDLSRSSKDENLLPMFNEELAFGDLLLNERAKRKEGTGKTRQDFDSDKDSTWMPETEVDGNSNPKWDDGVIPYYISKEYTSSEREIIEDAISGMNSKLTQVHFRPVKRLYDRNYLFIFSGKGCYSKLGMAGGPQPLSLQTGKCLKNGIVQHELMHSLNFCHEQNRPDRNDYIKLLKDNIPRKWLSEYQRNYPSEVAYIGKYDYYSVMHYPIQVPGKKDQNAFEVLDYTIDEEDIGNREELSEEDIEKIEEYYSE